jgi:hypothetical protein
MRCLICLGLFARACLSHICLAATSCLVVVLCLTLSSLSLSQLLMSFHPPQSSSALEASNTNSSKLKVVRNRKGKFFCPCLVLSCLVLPCLILSCLFLACLVLSCLFLSCFVFLVLSCFAFVVVIVVVVVFIVFFVFVFDFLTSLVAEFVSVFCPVLSSLR